jgi:hypothetical protein
LNEVVHKFIKKTAESTSELRTSHMIPPFHTHARVSLLAHPLAHPLVFWLAQVCCATEQAKRETHIWQAPIMHYKNYHSQPAVVKLCSLFVTQVTFSSRVRRKPDVSACSSSSVVHHMASFCFYS